MKNISNIFKNILFFTRLSYKEAPFQYFSAFLEIIWNVSLPFVNLVFPKFILDELTGEKDWSKVLLYIALWGGVNAVILLLKTGQQILFAPRQERNEIKEKLYYGLMDSNMDYGRLENGAVLDEKNRVRDNLYISYFAHIPLGSLVTAILKVIGYVYIIVTFHPIILGVFILITVARILLSFKKQKLEYTYKTTVSPFKRRFAYLFNAMVDISFAKEVRINNAAKWLSQKFEIEKEEYLNKHSENKKKNFAVETVGDILTFLQDAIVLTFCACSVMNGSISVGDFSLYISTFLLVSGAATDMMNQIVNLKYVSMYIDSYKAYEKASTPSHLLQDCLDIPASETHEIEFKNVSFQYEGSDTFALKNISFKIKSGSKLSIVGYNGAGKSTLIKLICRLYQPTAGVILYNGLDISRLNYQEYSKLISVVFQDYNIYNLSIRDNLTMASSHVDEENMVNALKFNGLEEKISALPNGLDTEIGKEFDYTGIEFSGGEGQKLACARAYLKDAPIMILDEPTASLDPISESRLYERFDHIVTGKTAIYISHRLASSQYCDNIIVLADGQIMESGTHQQLLAKKGIYAEMYAKQSENYVEDTDEQG